jgi:hypothetical protein
MKNGMIVDEEGNKYWYKNGKWHRKNGPAIEWADGSKYWYFYGQYHREDGPAVDEANGTKEWYINGQLHREDGPARERADGSKYWRIRGKLHREDGPAIEWADGTKEWCIRGKLHRIDGPAYEGADGRKFWCINGQYHREDGPAIEYADGSKEWYINGLNVPKYVVLQPEKITLERIFNAKNNEVRSIMIERYGWQRYLVDSDAKMLDKRDNAIENTKEALFATGKLGNRLVVTCPTGRIFTLGVPSDIVRCEEAQRWLGNASTKINVIGRT